MKRTIEISSRGTRLTLENSRIQVCREQETLASIPAEDLAMIILSSTGISLSSGVLKAMGEAGGAILACDDSYHPCGIFLPMSANTLHSERARMQAELSAPMRKNLWARIVRAKIRNQAGLLRQEAARSKLLGLADKVRSGDEGNVESDAARVYWSRVFADHKAILPAPFLRNREGAPPNNLLNYGYTVLRAATARALCAAGLHPAVGLHHRNRYSGFCLADDVMEPYRPFVDRTVMFMAAESRFEIDKDVKSTLIGVIGQDVSMPDGRFSLVNALEKTASSLALAIERQVKGGEPAPEAAESLVLPELPGR
jgi:CRISPR-associated protein Cas1